VSVIRASEQFAPRISTGLQSACKTVGLDMLPDLRFLICGVLFCFLLFAVTGAGVMLPDARTRIGEAPEIGRPMMQRSIVEVPAPAPYSIATAARRVGEPEQLREPAEQEAEAAPAQPEPDPRKSDAERPDLRASDVPASASDLPASERVMGVERPVPAVVAANPAPGSSPAPDSPAKPDIEAPVEVLPAAVARNDQTAETAGPQVAAVEPPPSPEERPSEEQPAAGDGELVPRFANVPLPQPRPAFFGFRRRAHLFHRRRRVIVVVRDPPAQTAPAQSAPGQAAQGAVVQGWQYQSVPVQNWQYQSVPVTANTSAAEAGKR
jgi:hypothetical protein